jgi:hypothetical protein
MRFMKNYGRVAHSALAYAMNDEFSRVLHQQMEFFSSNPSADTLNRLRGEVSEASAFLSSKRFRRTWHGIVPSPTCTSTLPSSIPADTHCHGRQH